MVINREVTDLEVYIPLLQITVTVYLSNTSICVTLETSLKE